MASAHPAYDASPSLPTAEPSPIPHVNEAPGHAVTVTAARSPLLADFPAAAEITAPMCARPSFAGASTASANLGPAADAAPTSQEAVTGDPGSPGLTSVGATANPPNTNASTFRVPQGSTGAFLP
jgi:hypothetical protein